ncbi:ABC transporter ATP-binding protein [Candidatus Berkelbacteria bacterium]|nr:ABC transporter ATP-binding protein [Candidatus Berkelbacteria bacterium]
MSRLAIDLKGLTKFYGKSRGIEDVTLQVREGEVFGFLGPNGAGKTTTIRLILDFIRPSRGTAQVFGLDSVVDSVKIKKKIGYLAGDIALYGHLTGYQLIDYLSDLNGGYDRQEFERLASAFKAQLSRPIHNLSKGNRQKIGLIHMLVHQPELLVFDEPSSGLDPFMQQILYEEIRKIKESGRTVFMSSHNLEEVQRTCDRAGFVRDGRIVAVETLKEMSKLNLKRYDVRFGHDILPSEFRSVEGVESAQLIDEETLSVRINGSVNPLIQKLSNYTVENITEQKTSLEEIFFHYYEGDDK